MIQILLALIQGLIAKVMEGLKRWLFNQEWFRIKFIYPKVRFRNVILSSYRGGGGCHAPARPYAPVSKPGLLDEGRVPRGVQGRTGA